MGAESRQLLAISRPPRPWRPVGWGFPQTSQMGAEGVANK